jgi:tRNA pseudouridine55 synthase
MQRYLLELPKTYVATARLGWRSSTGDPDGELEETGRIPERLELPTGEIEQRVPMTSAVKVDGERLYKKAHRGETVETPIRRITVHRAELLESDSERARFEIECSSGTYIRTLVETLEDAYCEGLRRTAIGELRIPEGGAEEISVEQLMSFLPERELTETEAEEASHGIQVPGNGHEGRRRLTREGRLIAIARPDGENLRPEVVLA